jgi:hypothetical protein
MSRSFHPAYGHRGFRRLLRFETRASRRQTHVLLSDEVRVERLYGAALVVRADDVLAVLADAEEEAGRLARAELLRRGRDLPVLPL